MANWGETLALGLSGLAIASLAFFLRIYIHLGRAPSGVDTWYFLAYARELRRTRRLPVRLKSYLLQEELQSYPPLFPIFLALIPQRLLDRAFWLVSPLLDCVHLLFLHVVAFKISNNLLAAALASLIYAVTPQLVSETRSLNSRAFGALVQSLAMMAVFRYVIGGEPWPWLVLALLLSAAVFLSHSSTAISFGVTLSVLGLVLGDVRFLGLLVAAPVLATLLSGGLYVLSLRSHVLSARFWIRHRYRMRAHQVLDSPLYGDPARTEQRPAARVPLSRLAVLPVARLIGENPFVLSVLAATLLGYLPLQASPWGAFMFWWMMAVLGWAIATTLIPPLRVFGPGYLYIKTSTFPTAYTLGALVVGGTPDVSILSDRALVTLAAFPLSCFSLWYFYRYIRTRTSEHTATAPAGLQATARYLASLPGRRFACLPAMYADYLAYNSGKDVLWGGHSGDPARLEGFYPVITRPLQKLFEQHRIDYFVLEVDYVQPERLALDDHLRPLERFERFQVYQVVLPEAAHGPVAATAGRPARPPGAKSI